MGHSGCDAVTAESVRTLFAKKLATTAGMKAYHAVMNKKGRGDDYEKLAQLCVQADVDPRPFIDWVFMKHYPNLPQSPRMLYPLVNEYVAAKKPDTEHFRTSILFENMFDRLSRCKPDKDVVCYLLDPLNEFSCVFAYCVAYHLNVLHRIPDKVVECAKNEIFLKPVYEVKFSEILPPR